MATVEDLLAQALAHHRAGRLNEADLFYRQILTDWPNNPDALHRFGVLAAQLGHHEPAANLIGRAIQQRPAAHRTCGDVSLRVQRFVAGHRVS